MGEAPLAIDQNAARAPLTAAATQQAVGAYQFALRIREDVEGQTVLLDEAAGTIAAGEADPVDASIDVGKRSAEAGTFLGWSGFRDSGKEIEHDPLSVQVAQIDGSPVLIDLA